jgi:holo-[acyl-carrier protein] synthase
VVVGPLVSVLGLGIDLVDLSRAARLLERKGEYALEKLMTAEEREYLASRPDPVPHFAVRLAAKEAVYKALQILPDCRGLGWQEIEVCRDPEGRPSIRFHGLAAIRMAHHPGLVIHLSLTHSASAAGAVAVVTVGEVGHG